MSLPFSPVLCLGVESKAHFGCRICILRFSCSVPGDWYEVIINILNIYIWNCSSTLAFLYQVLNLL